MDEMGEGSMMIANKKNIVGFALVASLLVGCQTAQKNAGTNVANSDAPYDEATAYGSDLPDFGEVTGRGGDRTPAGGGGVLPRVIEFFTETNKQFVHVGAQGAKKSESLSEVVMRELNRENPKLAYNEKLKAFKNSTREKKITRENIKNMDPELQAAVVKHLSQLTSMQADFGGPLRETLAQAEKVLQKGAKGGVEEVKGVNMFSRNASLSGDIKAVSGKEYSPEVYARYEEKLRASSIAQNPEVYGTKEGLDILDSNIKKAIEIKKLTGRSYLSMETCKDFDIATSKAYGELLDDQLEAAQKYGKDEKFMKDGKLCPEVEAWVAARFQEKLGRKGYGAWSAVEQMGGCKSVTGAAERAARGLASNYRGVVPNEPPKCQ